MMDDDDDFLYGGGGAPAHTPEKVPEPASRQSYTPEPMSLDRATELGVDTTAKDTVTAAPLASGVAGEDDEEEMDEESSEDDVEIITEPTATAPPDFKTAASRNTLSGPPGLTRVAVNSLARAPAAPIHPVHLTTEYTPLGRDREAVNHPPVKKPQLQSAPSLLQQTGTLARSSTPTQQTSGEAPTTAIQSIADTSNSDTKPESTRVEDSVDPKSLPSVRALSNAPTINPSAPGMLDGRSIYEVDIASLESKAWRRPGADLSDWFNYGFDEISWEAYCKRREIMGDMADKLKINVLNFANLTEEQFLNAAEARKPAILGAHLASMQMGGGPDVKPGMGVGMGGGGGPSVGIGAGFGSNMMGPQGGNMNMGMQGPGGPGGVQDMGGMNMGMMGMGMGMGGDMGMQDVVDGGPGGMGMEFGPSGPGIGGPMAMAMGGEFMGDPVMMGGGGTPFGGHGGMEPNQGVGGGPGPGPSPNIGSGPPTAPAAMSGGGGTPIRQLPIPGAPTGPAASMGGSGTSTSFVGATPPTGPAATRSTRGAPPPAPRAARGAFRGRGRGAGFEASGIPPRATSPLPPNVPTGPRSQHRYKDRDTNAPATEPLDYGADAGDRDRERDREGRSSTRERDRDRDRYDKDDKDDDRKSRKRRASPSDDGRERTSKRR